MKVGRNKDNSDKNLITDQDIVAGNVYDKYNTRNPIYRRLVSSYFDHLTNLLGQVHPVTVLEVGCGEGHMADFARKQLGDVTLVALDVSQSVLVDAVEPYSQVRFVCGNGYRLPFDDGQFDLVLALESLEHMVEAEKALTEIRRVSKRDVIVSVPQEPVWRILNFVRGAYLTDLGNTPGHVRHWSKRGIVRLLRSHFEVEQVYAPFPWTMARCRVV